MKKIKIGNRFKRASKVLSFASAGWLHYAAIVLVVGLVGAGGVKLTLASLAATPTANLTIHTYVGTGYSTSLGYVNVTVRHAGGNDISCRSDPGSTDGNGNLIMNCDLALNGTARTYYLAAATRSGYSYAGSFTNHDVTGGFHVASGGTTLYIAMNDDTPAPAPAPSPSPTPAPTPAPSQPETAGNDGVMDFGVVDTAGQPIDGVDITIGPVSGGMCTSYNGRQWKEGTAGGHVRFRCQTANLTNGPRDYMLLSASKAGYSRSAYSPHPIPDQFTVNPGNANPYTNPTSYAIILKRDVTAVAPASPAPGSTTTPGTQAPASPAAPAPGAPTVNPADQRKGSVQVTTYVYGADGKRTRLGGIEVHIKSANPGYATDDKAHNCPDYNQTTSSSGPASGANYGQVHFTGCWTGSDADNTEAYQLSYAQLPRGLSFKSFQITGPSGSKFLSGNTSTEGAVTEAFNVKKDQETTLEIMLFKNGLSQAANSSGVKEVITQKGTRYDPADDSEASKKAAAALNAANPQGGTAIKNAIEPPEPGVDDIPPSVPKNFKAVQDDSGSVALSWDASTGNPAGEAIVYDVERVVKDSTDAPDIVGDTTDGLTALDLSEDLEYPKTYVYLVTATDAEFNTSDSESVEITVTKPVSNVQGTDPDADPPATTSNPASTSITSEDKAAGISIPAGAASQDLACDISGSDSTGSDTLNAIGPVIGSIYSPVCTNDAGESEEEFSEDLDYSLEIDEGEVTDDTELYGYDGTDWELIPTSETDSSKSTASKGNLKYSSAKKTKGAHKTTYNVKSKRILKLALVNQKGGSPSAVTPVVTLMLLVVLGVAARTIVRRRLVASYAMPYGGDVDLISFQQSTTSTPTTTPTPPADQSYFVQPTAPPSQPTDVAQPITPMEQPRFIVHPDKPEDKK
ncbi:MAG: hypothetical protein JWO35_9 [Candidatus Saccharibacteria bacterium]|nr:hypothetical protein [Candidatus Saccharibacteria bacterium]